MASVYDINKGINRSIEFKGIKAQYIIYLAAGLVALLVVFAILYIAGCNIYLSLGIILPAGAALFTIVSRMSKKYGEHGLLKKAAAKRLPASVRSHSSIVFRKLKEGYGKSESVNRGDTHLQNRE